ncbi:hypothetical protein COLO4_02998 [Corchorus olitorius]|uniref:Uncharacterized protein n=1 Tax=Corchorus olitorius TaxID=93759 RepID=A0A1R3KZQ5_9ROSI|nr:hypothetical protein COLO4_02998 [Corchorus olitorius]
MKISKERVVEQTTDPNLRHTKHKHVRAYQRECKNGMSNFFPLGTEGLLILGCTFQRTYARPEKGILLSLPKSVLRKSLSTFEGRWMELVKA